MRASSHCSTSASPLRLSIPLNSKYFCEIYSILYWKPGFRIRDILIRIGILLLLFTSVTFKTLKKILVFIAYYFLRVVIFTLFFKDEKVLKKSQNSKNKTYSYYFCLMMDGSGSWSVTLTNGSGRPKNWTLPENISIRSRVGTREYWMRLLNGGPGFLAVFWFGTSPARLHPLPSRP